jgi:hypothetical protein
VITGTVFHIAQFGKPTQIPGLVSSGARGGWKAIANAVPIKANAENKYTKINFFINKSYNINTSKILIYQTMSSQIIL